MKAVRSEAFPLCVVSCLFFLMLTFILKSVIMMNVPVTLGFRDALRETRMLLEPV